MNRGTWTAEQIERWDVEKLTPYDKNARTHSEKQIEQIAASIGEFGFTNPILATGDGRIVAGHGRLQAVKKLGFKDVPVVVVDHLTQEQIKAYTLADNKLALNAGWDNDLLSVELSELAATGYDISLIGFDEGELSELLGNAESELNGDPDEVPEVQEVAITQPGDLWVMGDHRLLCGDSTDSEQLLMLLDGNKADMLFTDPPYGVDYEGGHFHSGKVDIKRKREKLANDNNAGIYCKIAAQIGKFVDGPCYIWFADSKAYEVYKALYEHKFVVHALLIWHKTNAKYAAMNAQYKQRHEPCLYCKPPGTTLRWIGDSTESTIWEIKRDAKNEYHPTQKPVELALKAIGNHKVQTVLDCFAGSGSTIIAAQQLGKKCYALEISPNYCDVIVKRWQQLTGKEAVNDRTGERFNDVLKRG
jgi:DNA modification methylase